MLRPRLRRILPTSSGFKVVKRGEPRLVEKLLQRVRVKGEEQLPRPLLTVQRVIQQVDDL